MTDVARERLLRIVERYGESVLSDHEKTAALISELCGEDRERIDLLIGALRTGLVADLLQWRGQADPSRFIPRISRTLEMRLGASPPSALWATAAWGVALRLLDEESADRLQVVKPPQPIPPRATGKVLLPSPPPDGGGGRHAGLIARIACISLVFLCLLWPVYCVSRVMKKHPLLLSRKNQRLDPAQEKVRFMLNREWEVGLPVNELQFSADGERLFALGGANALTAWDPASGAVLKTLPMGNDRPWALSPDGSRLAMSGGDEGIQILDVASEVVVGSVGGDFRQTRGMAFSPDGRFLMVTDNSGTRLDLLDAVLVRPFLQNHFTYRPGYGPSFAFSPNSQRIVTASVGDAAPAILEIGAVEMSVVQRFTDQHGYILEVCFDNTGNRIASAGGDKVIHIWDAKNGHETLSINANDLARRLMFHPTLPLIMVLTGAGQVRVWDTRSGIEVGRLEGSTRPFALSPDGSLIAIQGSVASGDRSRPARSVIQTYRVDAGKLEQ